MQIRKFKGLKKPGTLVLAAMMMVLSMSSTAFASPLIYDTEEGIGVEVHNPGNIKARATTDSNYVTVSGGTLWTTWDSSTFRANYSHASKENR